jgi:hypothetical protein
MKGTGSIKRVTLVGTLGKGSASNVAKEDEISESPTKKSLPSRFITTPSNALVRPATVSENMSKRKIIVAIDRSTTF